MREFVWAVAFNELLDRPLVSAFNVRYLFRAQATPSCLSLLFRSGSNARIHAARKQTKITGDVSALACNPLLDRALM